MGEFNKLYNYTIAEATDAHNIKLKANTAYNELTNKDEKVDVQ